MRRWFVGCVVTGLILATPVWAQTTKPLDELDGLRIEKAQLEVQFLEERVARLKERAVRMLQDIQRREGTEDWVLDRDAQRWTKPDPPKQEGK